MALNFPSAPNIGDQHQAVNGITYEWDGEVWNIVCAAPGEGATDLAVANRTGTTLDITSSTGTNATVPAASGTEAGLMTAAHQTKVEADDTPSDPRDPNAHDSTHDTHNDGRYAPIAHSTGAGDGADAHVTAVQKTNWDTAFGWDDHGAVGYLQNVVDDTAPVLGGDLTAGGASSYAILFTDAADAQVGSIGYASVQGGIGFGYTPTGDFVETDGGVLLKSGQVQLFGSAASFKTLEHSDPNGYMDVRVNTEGTIYTSPSAAPSWQQTDTGTDVVDIPEGVPGVWAEITGLGITLDQDVAVDDVLDITANITVTELGGRSGTISFGVGVDGSEPSIGTNPYTISSLFDGVVPVALKIAGHGGLTTGQALTIWVRMESREHIAFDPVADGSTNPHDLIVGVASASGGAPSVNLGTTYAANSVTVTNSAGSDAVISEVGADAGVVSTTQYADWNAKFGPGSVISYWDNLTQDIGNIADGTTVNVDGSLGHKIVCNITASEAVTINIQSTMNDPDFSIRVQSSNGQTVNVQVNTVAAKLPTGADVSATGEYLYTVMEYSGLTPLLTVAGYS